MRTIVEVRKLTAGLLGVVAIGLAAPALASATATYNVNTTADTNAVDPAVSAQDSGGNISIRSALENVNTTAPAGGATINVPAGTYKLTSAGGAGQGTQGALDVSATVAVKIAGAGASSTRIDANYLDRAFQIDQGATVTISGVTVKHGRSGPELAGDTGTSCPATAPTTAGPGGAIVDLGTLTLTNDTFTDNMSAGNGGAVEDEGGLSVTGSSFSANNACVVAPFSSLLGFGNGGAIDEVSSKNWSVDTSTVSGNFAQGDGGGLSESGESDPTLTVTNSTIANNHSELAGGGIVGEGSGVVSLFADTLTGNTAKGDGGGIAGNDTDQVVNTTITNNFAGCKETIAANCTDSSGSGEGGGIENAGAPVTISFSTINNNNAEGGNGGNLANGDSASYTIDDSIITGGIADDSPENCSGSAFTSAGFNLFDDSGSDCGAIASDLKNANPHLGALANNGGPTETEALLSNSPAIDAANPVNAISGPCAAEAKNVDERGEVRPDNGETVCDIGAYEFNDTPPAGPDLQLSAAVGTNPIVVGQHDTVTDTITNTGGTPASDVQFTDPAAGFTIDSVSPGKGSCTHTATSVTCSLGTLGKGKSVKVKIHLTGTSPGTITLNSQVTMQQTDPTPGNDKATVTIRVNTQVKKVADLAISVVTSAARIGVGRTFTFTLKVSNLGPDAGKQVSVTDHVPDKVDLVSVHPGKHVHCQAGQTVTCGLGTLKPGASRTIEVVVRAHDPGLALDRADDTDNSPSDPNLKNNKDQAGTLITQSLPSIGVNRLGAGCRPENSGFDITAEAIARAGIRSVVVTVGGHVVRTYRPASHSGQQKRLVIHIRGPQFVPGRRVNVVVTLVDGLGRSTRVTRHFSICRTAPHGGGFTG